MTQNSNTQAARSPMPLDLWVTGFAAQLQRDIEITLQEAAPEDQVRIIMTLIRQWERAWD